MLTFAFDAGGDDGTDYMTVAGFVSSAKHWDEFSLQWKERLSRDGIAFFRAVDANSFRGPFEHWRKLPEPERFQLRQSLFRDLMNLIKSHAYRKFACTITNKEFQSTNNEARQKFALSAYIVAARTCEKNARQWAMDEWKSCPTTEMAFVFEAGDKGQRGLQNSLRKSYGNIPANFLPKKDTRREDGGIGYGFVPLQAADWLAWELNRAARDSANGPISESSLRWPMQEFFGPPAGNLGIYTPENLKAMDDMIALEDKIISWEVAKGLGQKEPFSIESENGHRKTHPTFESRNFPTRFRHVC